MAIPDFLRNNSMALLQGGVGLLGGRTASEQAAGGFQGFGNAMQANKTIKFLEAANPELAQAVKSGAISGGDAYKMFYQQKLEAQKPMRPIEVNGRLVDPKTYQVVADFSTAPPPKRSFQTLPNGQYGFADETAGTFSPLGTAPKQEDKLVQDYESRRTIAARMGLTPESPAYQSFLATGKMPREDQAPLTATDKKAILEADEAVSTNEAAMGTIDQALAINKKANAGFGASARATLGNNLPDVLVPDFVSSPESSEATTEYDNLVQNQALQQLKTIFGGNPTEGERAILLELQASSGKQPEVRARILTRAKELAARRLEFNRQRASGLRGGDYYKPSGTPTSGGTSGRTTSNGLKWGVE